MAHLRIQREVPKTKLFELQLKDIQTGEVVQSEGGFHFLCVVENPRTKHAVQGQRLVNLEHHSLCTPEMAETLKFRRVSSAILNVPD